MKQFTFKQNQKRFKKLKKRKKMIKDMKLNHFTKKVIILRKCKIVQLLDETDENKFYQLVVKNLAKHLYKKFHTLGKFYYK